MANSDTAETGRVGLIAGGSALALAGAITQGRQITIHPIPPADAVLCARGSYAAMRHPIYTGLLCAVSVAILKARPEPVIAFATMIGVLSSKATFEEQILHRRFGDAYRSYCHHAPRGLPPTPGNMKLRVVRGQLGTLTG